MSFRNYAQGMAEGKDRGGAALEYVVVSIFGLALSIAAVGYISQAVEKRLEDFSANTGIEFDSGQFNRFSESNP